MEFLIGIAPREYQQKIFETCVNKNCLVILPTGLGKTLIALMLTIDRMKKFPGEKVIFLAPTKPLVEQHLNYFKKHLSELFAEMNIFTGQINSKERKKLWQTSDIIFSTPQCVANDLNKKLYDLSDVCLLIEDEAHRCIKNYDYNYVAHEYIRQSSHPRIIGLTASPGSDYSKIKEICRNLSIEEVESKTRDSSDVKEYLQELNFEKMLIDFPEEFNEIKRVLKRLFDSYVQELKNRKLLFGSTSKTALIELQKKLIMAISKGQKDYNHLLAMTACASAIKLQHAIELIETQTLSGFSEYLKELFKQASDKKSKGVIRLVSKPEFNLAYLKSQELLSQEIEHPKLGKLMEIVKKEKSNNDKIKIIIFTQFRNTASIISKKLNEIEGIKARVFVGQAKKTNREGSTGLSQKEQKKMIEEFSSGEVNVLCATSIGEEGLDIPEVNIVLFYEPVPSAIRTIQRRGRTARLIPGKLIMLITKGTRDEAYYWTSFQKEKKMHKIINELREDFGMIKSKEEKQEELF